jgi:hypothetical protein
MVEWIADNYLILVSVIPLIVSFITIVVIIAIIRYSLHFRDRYYTNTKMKFPSDWDIVYEETHSPKIALPKPERVEFAVFSPLNIVSGGRFVLDVWAYLPGQYPVIAGLAKEVGREDLLGKKHGVPVERGTILSVSVEIDMLEVREPTDTILWDGVPTNASYIVNVPSNASIGQYVERHQ